MNLAKNITNSSVFIQWDAVNDSLPTTYIITWTRAGGGLQPATPTEQTSYTITGLTLDTVYTITVTAANTCGSGPEFSTSIILSTNATSNTSSISPTVTASANSMSISIANTNSTIVAVTANPMTISTTANTTTAAVTNPSITTIDSVITTESKNIFTTISNPNIEIATTTFTTTKQSTNTAFLSISPVKTNMANENSKFKARLRIICIHVYVRTYDVISYL